MKTYNVLIVPYVFEAPEYSDEVYEYLSPLVFPSFIDEDRDLKPFRTTIDADNIEEALSKSYTFMKIDVVKRTSTPLNIICYKVLLNYFYGRSLRERSFEVWVSRALRERFLEKNRSYLTREQIESICSSDLSAFDRYLTNE